MPTATRDQDRGERRWYAVQTQPQREALAAEQLGKQAFEVFFPRQRKTVRHARRITERTAAYFPGYLFVRLDLDRDRWRAVNGTFGVRGLVMAGERPRPAPKGLIEALSERVDSAGFLAAPPTCAPGDQVRLVAGPLADLIGTLDRLEGPARVRVLIELVGGRVPVVVAPHDIAQAG